MDETKTTAQAPHSCLFCGVVGPQIEALLDHVWPEKTQEHFRNARIEMLKGIRGMLDARIDRLSQHNQKGTRLTVE
jgi:hypothetical protein